jgi:CelD/BcsL family acetyltransferase involved in cellulose biosynthesis
MKPQLRCRLIDNYDELLKLSEAWDQLVYKSDFPDLFATSGFARAWWRAYGEDRKLNLLVVEDETGDLRLVAPFQSLKTTPTNWELIGRPRGDYNNFILAKDDRDSLECLFEWLKSHPHWKVLTLRRIPGESTLLRFFEKPYNVQLNKIQKLQYWLKLGSWLVYQETHHEHPLCTGETFQKMEDILQRLHHRRKTNWLKTQGDLRYQVITDPNGIKAYLPKFFELHMREWTRPDSKGSFLRHQVHRDFYNYIVEEMSKYNGLRFDAMTINGELIAAHIGFHWAGRLYYWLACYDTKYRKGSPGRLLLGNIIDSAHQLGMKELDMLFGLERYKEDFKSEIRETGALTIYRSPLIAARLQKRWQLQACYSLLKIFLGE